MDFKMALEQALNACGKHATDPNLLYCALCDVVGSDFAIKPQVEGFHSLNKSIRLVETMAENTEPRTIGVLLEKCKGQTDMSEKVCLRWIHTVFEFYYRKQHGKKETTEQVLKSLEADLFEPVQEGLNLPKPKKKKFPPKKTSNPPDTKKALPKTPKAKKPKAAPSPPKPKTVHVSTPNIPENAYVYIAEGSNTVHVSAECPHIRPALGLVLYRATYKRAQYKDFVRVNNIKIHSWTNYEISKFHVPPICSKCGEFTPILSYRNPKIKYKQW